MTLPLTTRTARYAALAAATSLAIVGCSTSGGTAQTSDTGETVTVEHAQGSTEVPLNPEKTVVMDLGVVDTMNALDIDPAGLPKANLPEPLSQYDGDQYVNAGNLKEPDMEAIAESDPDLIIISGRTSEFYDEFAEIAPTVDLTPQDNKDLWAAFENQVQTVGTIWDKEDEAQAAMDEVTTRIDDLSGRSEDAGNALVVLSNAGELSAYGPGSRFGLIYDQLGFKPATEVTPDGSHGMAMSFEAVAEAEPENIFVVDRDSATGASGQENAQQVMDNELVAQTPAAKNDRIYYLDSANWYLIGYGLDNVNRMIDEVEPAL